MRRYLKYVVFVLFLISCSREKTFEIEVIGEIPGNIEFPCSYNNEASPTLCYGDARSGKIYFVNKQTNHLFRTLRLKQGMAPGEISRFRGIAGIYLYKNLLFVFDEIQSRINIYDTTGNFIRDFKLRERYWSMTGMDSSLVLIKDVKYLKRINFSGKVIREIGDLSKIENGKNPGITPTLFAQDGEKIYLTSVVDYNVVGYDLKTGNSIFYFDSPHYLKGKIRTKKKTGSISIAYLKGLSSIVKVGDFLLVSRFNLEDKKDVGFDVVNLCQGKIISFIPTGGNVIQFLGSGEDSMLYYCPLIEGSVKFGFLKSE